MAEHGNGLMRLRTWLVGILVVGSAAGCSPLDDALAALFPGRSMRSQPSVGTYDNPRLPAENTVPFAAGNFPQAPGSVNIGQPELAEVPPPVTTLQLLQQAPEVMEIANPVEATPASLARGEVMYDRACSPCHGAGGEGDGPVAQAGMPSFSLLIPQAMEYPDGYIYTIVRIGRGAMPPYAHQITNYDRWHIVNYVRQLQGVDAEPAADTATPDQAEEQ